MNLVQIFPRQSRGYFARKNDSGACLGDWQKVDTFIEMLKPFQINEVTRTGCVAINRLSGLEKSLEAKA